MIFFFDSTPNISFIKDQNLEESYRLMAQDEAREVEALEWAEATVGDVGDETDYNQPINSRIMRPILKIAHFQPPK